MYQQVRTCGCLMHVPAGENMWMSYACTSRWEHVDVLCMYQQVRTCGCLMHVPAGENMWMSYACTSRWEHVDVLCMYQQVRTHRHLMHIYQQVRTHGCLMHVPAGENTWMSYACTSRWKHMDVFCMSQQVRDFGRLMLEHVDVLCNKDGEKTPNSLSFVAVWYFYLNCKFSIALIQLHWLTGCKTPTYLLVISAKTDWAHCFDTWQLVLFLFRDFGPLKTWEARLTWLISRKLAFDSTRICWTACPGKRQPRLKQL